ncbi:hypothetical protein D3C71_1828470 [compost metagenome]
MPTLMPSAASAASPGPRTHASTHPRLTALAMKFGTTSTFMRSRPWYSQIGVNALATTPTKAAARMVQCSRRLGTSPSVPAISSAAASVRVSLAAIVAENTRATTLGSSRPSDTSRVAVRLWP